METTTIELPEYELPFDICYDDYDSEWDAVNELIKSSGCDASLVTSICKQPSPAPNGWPIFYIYATGEETARKIVARYIDVPDIHDPEVDEYLNVA